MRGRPSGCPAWAGRPVWAGGGSLHTGHGGSSLPENPLEHLKALIAEYTIISFIPDLDRYRRISAPKEGSCIFRGCTEFIAWEDARGGNFLCEGHYHIMRRWVEDARRGLLPGGEADVVFSHAGGDR